jgi:hypothetical protein
MSIDERLRALLAERAEAVAPAPDWDDLETRLDRARRRRRGRALAGVAAFVLTAGPAAGFLVARAGQDESPSVVAASEPSTETTCSAGDAGDAGDAAHATEPSTATTKSKVTIVPPRDQVGAGSGAQVEAGWITLYGAGSDDVRPFDLGPDGPPPEDEEAAREAIVEAYTVVWSAETSDETRAARLDDACGVAQALAVARANLPDAVGTLSVQVNDVQFLNPTSATVAYTLQILTPAEYYDYTGRAVLVDGDWKVTRDTVCGVLALVGADCDAADGRYSPEPRPTPANPDGGEIPDLEELPEPTPPPGETRFIEQFEMPEPDGPPPADEASARQAVIDAYRAVYSDERPDETRTANVDDPRGLDEASAVAVDNFPTAFESLSVRVDEVRFLNPTTAAVRYDILTPRHNITEFSDRVGRAVLVDGDWKVARETICNDLALAGASCDP